MGTVHELETTGLADALTAALAMLDTERRAWVVGLARLLGTPDDAQVPDLQRMVDAITWVRERADLPTGALSYVAEPEIFEPMVDVRVMVFRHAHPDGSDFLEVLFGLGPGGHVAVGMTRSGDLGRGESLPSHVLVTDVEALCTDLMALSFITSQVVGHSGPTELLVGIGSDVPGEPLRLRSLDPETGGPAPETDATTFTPVTGVMPADPSFRDRYEAIVPMLAEMVAQFGLSATEYLPMSYDDIAAERLVDGYVLPAHLRAPGAPVMVDMPPVE